MAGQLLEEWMKPGSFFLDVDYNPDLRAKLVDEQNRPRKLHAMFFDRNGELMCPPMLLTAVGGDEKGMKLGGLGPSWHLGYEQVGPRIRKREYISGNNRLSNGEFGYEDLYWRRPSQDSLWVIGTGSARCAGGLLKDDVLEPDERYAVNPGQQYRVRVIDITGEGIWRQRTLYEGQFNPPNLLANGDFELGPEGDAWSGGTTYFEVINDGNARSGNYSLRFAPIAKPELVDNHDMEGGPTNWTGADGIIDIVEDPGNARSGSWVMQLSPNPQPQRIIDPDNHSGWVDVSENPLDMDIVYDEANAYSTGWVMKLGPVTPKQLLLNPTFADGFAHWYQSSNVSEPDDVYYVDSGGGVEGATAITSHPTELIGTRYLRSDASDGISGVQAYTVVPGESWELEVFLRVAPSTSQGYAYGSLVFPHPTLEPLHHRWNMTQHIECARAADDQFQRLSVTDTVPTGRTKVYVLLEIHDQVDSYVAWSYPSLIRTRGNRGQLNSIYDYDVLPGVNHELSFVMRSVGEMQTGNIRYGVILSGPGMLDRVVDQDRGSTDFVWSGSAMEFRPPAGYVKAKPFFAALDVYGDAVYADHVQLKQIEGNTAVKWGNIKPVLQDQRYFLSAAVRTIATRGVIRVGAVLTGTGLPDLDLGEDQDLTNGAWAGVGREIRVPTGYTHLQPYVRTTDLEGGLGWVDGVSITQSDNNSVVATGDYVSVVPERSFRYSMAIKSSLGTQRGSAKLVVNCSNGTPDFQRFESPDLDLTTTAGLWTVHTYQFTPPSSYDNVLPTIQITDLEGGYAWCDEGEIRDVDGSTVAIDVKVGNPAHATLDLDTTAPDGAEFIRCAAVVQRGSSNWSIGGVSLSRIGVPFVVGNEIVADLLTDPTTGEPLSIDPGAINCPEPLTNDWTITRQTNLEALDDFCTIVSSPPKEYRINASDPPTIDVATYGALSVDHAPDSDDPVVISPEDRDVQDLSNPENDVSTRGTEIEVIGAEKRQINGRPFIISAVAPVPGDPEYDYNNREIRRTRTESDATIDHRTFANALAEDDALKEATPALSLRIKLSGRNTAADRPPGDWVYVNRPAAGLEDESVETPWEGEGVSPRRVRIQVRERELGAGVTVEMRASDGSRFPLLFNPSDQETTTLTVGDRKPDWEADPTGQARWVQYIKDYQSRPGRAY